MKSRMQLTQSRMRVLLVAAFITAFLLICSNISAAGSHPAFDKPVGPNGVYPLYKPRKKLDTHHGHKNQGPLKAQKPPGPPKPPKPPTPPKPPAPVVAASSPESTTKAASKDTNAAVVPAAPAKTDSKDETGYLSIAEAQQFCGFRRFETFANRDKKRKIYDLVMINRELEWLDIRLGQMYSHVDYFIIVEAAKTFTDNPKTLYVETNWDRYAPYHDKMIRHTLNDEGMEFDSTWERETFSRNAMVDQVIPFLEGDQKIEVDDVIIIADVDEIPRPETLTALRNCAIPTAVTLRSKMYYYSFQWHQRGADWTHPQAMLWNGTGKTMAADTLRMGAKEHHHMHNAAWHCSYCLKSLSDMVNKVTSFSHFEFNQPEFRDPEKILNRVRHGLDFFDRDDMFYDRVEDNQDVPEFLKEHSEKYAFAVNRDPPNGNFQD
ncbi:hypothetical protein V493_03767 [Pseudogymnoascus sp. VKM F-4281 (FW-2241)]|nr:hypothetical protein V493_03767 [Pseudogymnoascus sp. VKM F-4281 (FW-2241)]